MGFLKKIIPLCFLALLVFPTPALFPQQPPATVQRVLDGRTLELSNGETVSLIGIDMFKDIEQGKRAAEFTRQLVEGKQVRLEYDVQKKDKCGRTLVHVFVDTVFPYGEQDKSLP